MMNSMVTVMLILAFAPLTAFADEVVKTCMTEITGPDSDKLVPTKIEIIKTASGYSTKLTQVVSGQTLSYDDVAELTDNPIREGMLPSADTDKLNLGESLINHAMLLEEEPLFEHKLTTGIDLKAVRSVKAYVVGKQGNMGLSAIVEARDAEGKELGSFLGGFLISPCKK